MADPRDPLKFHWRSAEEAREAARDTVWYMRRGRLMPFRQAEEILEAIEHGAYREDYWCTYLWELDLAEIETGKTWLEMTHRELDLIAEEKRQRRGGN